MIHLETHRTWSCDELTAYGSSHRVQVLERVPVPKVEFVVDNPPNVNQARGKKPIRVLVASLSGVTLQVVTEAISKQPDFVLVGGTAQTQLDLLLSVNTSIDVIVLGVADSTTPPGICTHLLNEFPHLKILVLSTIEAASAIYWLDIRRQRVAVASTQGLVQGIRHAAQLTPTL